MGDRHYVILLTEVNITTYKVALTVVSKKREKYHLNLIKCLDLATLFIGNTVDRGKQKIQKYHREPINKIQMVGNFTG